MKKIVLTSINPVKLNVIQKVTSVLFPHETFDYITLPLEKDGPEPIGKEAVMAQTKIAIDAAKTEIPDADYYVCMEGSMIDDDTIMNEVAYVTVQSKEGNSAISSCSSFPVPTAVAEEVRKGKGFAEAVDDFFKTNGTKQGGGFVNILTGGIINKGDHYFQPTVIAFSAVEKSEWY